MREYLLGLLLCSVFSAVLCGIFPSEALSRQGKFVAGLCIICVAIKPAVGVVEFIRDFDIKLYLPAEDEEDYEQKWEDYSGEYGERIVREYIDEELKNTFAVSASKINVTGKSDGGEFSVEKIYIELPRTGIFKDAAKIQVYFEKIFSCDVVVAIE